MKPFPFDTVFRIVGKGFVISTECLGNSDESVIKCFEYKAVLLHSNVEPSQ